MYLVGTPLNLTLGAAETIMCYHLIQQYLGDYSRCGGGFINKPNNTIQYTLFYRLQSLTQKLK